MSEMSDDEKLKRGKIAGRRISEILFEHYPKMKEADPEEHARAAAVLADVLGCVMAVYLKHDNEVYTKFLERVMQAVRESSEGILKRANEIKAELNDPYRPFKH